MIRMLKTKAHLLESSRIPANALYQAVNAASSPKNPPALIIGGFGAPLELRCRYPMPRRRNAMSRVKKRVKNATVERSVATKRMVVKMNQPCKSCISGKELGMVGQGNTIRKKPKES